MTNFNQLLHDYILELISKSIDSEGNDIARILVNGIPFDLSKSFIDELVNANGLIVHGRSIPIVVFDKSVDASQKPEDKLGGVCGKDHVLNLRNTSSINDIVILLAEGSSLDKSNTTSLLRIGIKEGVDNQDWINEHMIQILIRESLEHISFYKYQSLNDLYLAVESVIDKYKSTGSHEGDHYDQWKLISSITESVSSGSKKELRSLLGMINEVDQNTFKTARCEKIFDKIADSFESEGVNSSINEWCSKGLKEEIKSALKDFQKHYLSKCESASLFRNSPYFYYGRLQWVDSQETWWEILTVEVWTEILEDAEELQGACTITIENNLFKNNKPCPIVLEEVKFKLTHQEKFTDGSEIKVHNKRGRYQKIDTIQVNGNVREVKWETTPQNHKSPTFYKFGIDGYKDSTQKVISLLNYAPGFLFDIPHMQKATALKEKKDKRSSNTTWVSSVVMSNSGSHELTFYFDPARLTWDHAETKEKASGELVPQNISPVIEGNRGSASFSLNAECLVELRFTDSANNNKAIFKLSVSVSETEPVGARNVFDKLILQNLSRKGAFEKISVYSSWSKLDQLQKWILDEPEISSYPLLLGTDFNASFQKPAWPQSTVISGGSLNIDCRPLVDGYQVPEDLLSTRKKLIQLIRESNSDEPDGQPALIEYIEFGVSTLNSKLDHLLKQYFKHYSSWIKSEPQNALWYEMVAIAEVRNGVIDNDPFAILLNPLHPVRMGWLFQAQNYLLESLKKNIPCPAAGILDSSSFPDAYSLPCFTSQGQYNYHNFLSIGNDSPTWGLMWRGDKLDLLEDESITSIFSSDFGLQMEGLESGLSSSQIRHTLDDIYKIKSGKNSVSVKVYSESSETERFNHGVFSWVRSNLGSDQVINGKKEVRDLWFSSGSKQLQIYDTRKLKFQPTSEELVSVTQESGYNLKWFSAKEEEHENNIDLTILSHLTNQSPTLIQAETSSVIYKGGLLRERIRYSTKDSSGKLSFTESRVFSDMDLHSEDSEYNKGFVKLINIIEKEAHTRRSSHVTSTPRLEFVKNKLKYTDYCAIASSVVDPSAFFDHDGRNYLWDYDLPNYAFRNSSRSGFYLLARDTEAVRNSIKKSLKSIPGLGNISNVVVSEVMSEISGRGIPTLKTLASGGANASGEIGMLVAMSLLQNFDNDDESFEFFPVKLSNTVNLLIPIDPFESQINTLCDALGMDRSRPDLIGLSICIDDDRKVENILLTPIEVKYRNTVMNLNMMRAAHMQCESFQKLYDKLVERGKESVIWDMTRTKLIADMISFAFATYGRRIEDLQEVYSWAKLQSNVIGTLNYLDQINFNSKGRLIVVSDYNISEFDSISEGNTLDTLKIAFADAKDLLLGTNSAKYNKLGEKVGNWGLVNDCKKTPIEPASISEDNQPSKFPKSNEVIENENESDSVPEDHGSDNRANELAEEILSDVGDGIKFVVGHQEGALSKAPYDFNPSNTKLNQLNIGIVGDLGTGKTQLLKALLYSISRYPSQNRGIAPKFLVMDTKRDYDGSGDKQSDKNFVKSINAKVVKPHNLPINLFDIRNSQDDHPALTKAEFFIDILKKIFGGIGPNQEDGILTAVIEAFETRGYEPYQDDYSSFKSPTLKDIFDVYSENLDGKKDSPYSLMHKLVLARFFEADSEKTIDFADFFNQSVVLSLGGIASNDRYLKMVMIIFMNMYREYMLGVKKYEFQDKGNYQLRRIDSYLLIDEANLIMEYQLPVLEDLLLKGREFGIGIILSSQYLSHFKKSGTNYIEPLLTWFVHKVPNVSVKELRALGLTNADEGTVSKIKSMDCHFCLYKSLDAPGIIIKGIPHYVLDSKNMKKN